MDYPEDDDDSPDKTYSPRVSNSMKWWLAIFLGIVFFIVALGAVYNLSNAVWTSAGFPTYLCGPGCPNAWGVFIHAIIFVIIIRLILW